MARVSDFGSVVLTRYEAAKILGMPARNLKKWEALGHLPVVVSERGSGYATDDVETLRNHLSINALKKTPKKRVVAAASIGHDDAAAVAAAREQDTNLRQVLAAWEQEDDRRRRVRAVALERRERALRSTTS